MLKETDTLEKYIGTPMYENVIVEAYEMALKSLFSQLFQNLCSGMSGIEAHMDYFRGLALLQKAQELATSDPVS